MLIGHKARKTLDKLPDVFIVGMKYMRPVAMLAHPGMRASGIVAISRDMVTLFKDAYLGTLFGQQPGDGRAG
jgi:hypothetical protein